MLHSSTTLELHPSSVAEARRFVNDQLADWGKADVAGWPLALLTSELVTNALVHGRGPIRVDLMVTETEGEEERGGQVREEVADGDHSHPMVKHPDTDHGSGRGMILVDALADRWGISSRDGYGKAVWFELDLPPRRDDPA